MLVFILFNEVEGAAQDLMIFPKRIVFDGVGKRTAIVNLSNTGTDSVVYEVSFVQIRMKGDGGFETINEPDSGQLFADKYLRYFPRKVTLAPRESQVVKIQLNAKNNLQPGEYRSHLYFRAVPDEDYSLQKAGAKEDSSSITIRLRPVYGITIPVIIRIGNPVADVSISDLSFQKVDDHPIIAMRFNRSGARSTYGDIDVMYTPKEGKSIKVAEISGFAVYTPGSVRKVKVELKRDVDYRDGTFTVSYWADGTGKKAKLAEAKLMLD